MQLSKIVSGLKTKLQSIEGAAEVLGQVDELIETAKQFDGLDPQGVRQSLQQLEQLRTDNASLNALSTERDTLQQQLQQSNQTEQDLRTELMAVRAMGNAGVNPDYEELLTPVVKSAVVLSSDGKASLPDGFFDNLKTKYAAAFFPEDAAGTGATASGEGAGATTAASVSVGSDRVISGIEPEAILSGEVQLVEG